MAVAESAAVVLQMDPLKVCSLLSNGMVRVKVMYGSCAGKTRWPFHAFKCLGREDLGPLREFYPQKGPLPLLRYSS